MSKEGFRLFKN